MAKRAHGELLAAKNACYDAYRLQVPTTSVTAPYRTRLSVHPVGVVRPVDPITAIQHRRRDMVMPVSADGTGRIDDAGCHSVDRVTPASFDFFLPWHFLTRLPGKASSLHAGSADDWMTKYVWLGPARAA